MKINDLLTPVTADENAPYRNALDRGHATHTRTATDPVLSGSPGSTRSVNAMRLAERFDELLDDLAHIGSARIRTRNAHAELDVEARYARPSVFRAADAQQPVRENAAQDVALVSANTRHRVVTEVMRESLHATRQHLRMHDGDGNEIHSTTLTGKTDRDAWQALVELYSLPASGNGRQSGDTYGTRETTPAERVRCGVGVRHSRTPPLQPFHGFRRFSLARELETRAMHGLLRYLSENRIECSVSVGNKGIAQENRMQFDRMDVREGTCVLHSVSGHLKLSTPADASCWAVSGILNDEVRHSIELHDRYGNVIVRISTRPDIFYWNSLLYAAG